MNTAARLKILVVEDNPSDARLVREALTHVQAEVELSFATDGVQALRALREVHAGERAELVLLDLKLPQLNGDEVLRAIRADDALRALPVVVFSSSDAREDVRRAYELGANAYLTKRPDLEGLFTAMAALRAFWLDSARLPRTRRTEPR